MDTKGRNPQSRGLILIYTGNGKGKTTAALGLALRAAGHKKKTAMVQFIKTRGNRGEIQAADLLAPFLEIIPMGEGFVEILNDRKSFEEHRQAAAKALQKARDLALCGHYEILVLDEINYAIRGKLLSVQEVKNLLRQKPPGLHVVLTGRNAHPELIEMADLVTEMREIKHPYQQGIPAQPGLDY